MSVNKVILIGRLGQDPELRYVQSGEAVCSLSIATTESWSKDGQRQERTEWHRVVAWGKTAENINQYLSKGRQVYIEGRLQTRSWEDTEGAKCYSTEIVISKIEFLGSSKNTESEAA